MKKREKRPDKTRHYKRKPIWQTDVKVRYQEVDRDVVRGTWPSGSIGLLLVNPETGGALPATVDPGRSPRHPNEVFVLDVDGLVKALEDAKIIKATDAVEQRLDGRIRACELIHPELKCPEQPRQLAGYVERAGERAAFSNPRQEPEVER